MFGYIMVNKGELKVKEYDRYKAYYCGLCNTLKKMHGIKGQLLLSYDMTFLTILLTSLYEPKSSISSHRCITQPLNKCNFIENIYTEYAADMTILLSWHNCQDDWRDDKNYIKYLSSAALKKSYNNVRQRYGRQSEAIEGYMKKLRTIEKKKLYNPDLASSLTGDMLKEIFVIKEGTWSSELSDIGYYLGKFIYLMDAYEDIDKDIQKSLYNPLISYYDRNDFEHRAKEMLTFMAANAAKAMERLPLIKDVMLLRNIIYSGIWTRYAAINSTSNNSGKAVLNNNLH